MLHMDTPPDRPNFQTDAPTSWGFTFSNSHLGTDWSDFRRLTWPQLVEVLTSHVPGIKEGSCLTPAAFRGSRRHKSEADRIDVAFLDSDSGLSLAEIEAALKSRGWEGVVSSTHSHMSARTRVGLGNWDKFFSRHPDATAEQFLIESKGYLPRIAAGAHSVETTDEYVFIQHQPCPKFRVAIPLERPWLAADYPSQDEANAAWKERIEALAAALNLDHDQACTDTSRLFYLPRKPANGVVPETAVIAGHHCDLFALPAAAISAPDLFAKHQVQRENERDTEYLDPINGEVVDLSAWIRDCGTTFLIAKALRSRKPGALTGHVSDAKVHIDCPNAAAHTDPARDGATYCVNAGASQTKGFVIHCRHAHCEGKDRIFFVRRMLEMGWLACDDLRDARFQVAAERPAADQQGESAVKQDKPALWRRSHGWAEAAIPPRPWVVRDYLMRGAVTVVSGPGSAGKSSLMVAWCCAMGLGQHFSRFRPSAPLKVGTYNVEDDCAEQMRRFSASLRQFDRTPFDVMENVTILGPENVGALLALDANGQVLLKTQVMEELERYIEEERPDVLILDPFVELHGAEENDNTAVRRVLAWFRGLAGKYSMALCILHHARKGGTTPGDPDSLRGASAIVGAARVALTLNVMTAEEAQSLGLPEDHRRDYFRLDGAKANYSRLDEAEWFERQVYVLGNGTQDHDADAVAAAVPWNPPAAVAPDVGTLGGIVSAINRGLNGLPYSPKLDGEGRSIRSVLREFGITTVAAEKDTLATIERDFGVTTRFFWFGTNKAKGLVTSDSRHSVRWVGEPK